ncbi:unnamed protein product [Paramecium sonneborni]|uniref:Uncharacterized protein n=1 Tax=Paramecium sonneborni TaxID=65129 RepID=A0A8S1PET4_9CILI|nr:unnamed protein product [Paramecium sonneborni]
MVYSFGQVKGSNPALRTFAPAPNAYHPKFVFKQQALQWTQAEFILEVLVMQHKGYDSKIEGPKYTMSGKHDLKLVSLSPGPGNYDDESFSSVYKKQLIYTLVGLKYHTSQQDIVPGPGQCDLKFSYISNSPTQPRLTSLKGGMTPRSGWKIKEYIQKTLCKYLQIVLYQRNHNLHEQYNTYYNQNLKLIIQYACSIYPNFLLSKRSQSSNQIDPGQYDQDISTIKSNYLSYKTEDWLSQVHYRGQLQLFKFHINQEMIQMILQPQLLDLIHRWSQLRDLSIIPIFLHTFQGLDNITQMIQLLNQKMVLLKLCQNVELLTSGQYSIKSYLKGPQWGFSKDIRLGLIKKELIPRYGAYKYSSQIL